MDNALNDLPPVPKKNERIGRHEPIVGIVLSTVFLVVMLWGAPHLIGIYSGSAFVPMFDQAALQRQWALIAGIFALGVLKEVLRLNEGRYTLRLAFKTLILDVCSLVLMVLFVTAPGSSTRRFRPRCMRCSGTGANSSQRYSRSFRHSSWESWRLLSYSTA
jgi:hypothetical protein